VPPIITCLRGQQSGPAPAAAGRLRCPLPRQSTTRSRNGIDDQNTWQPAPPHGDRASIGHVVAPVHDHAPVAVKPRRPL